MMKFGFENEFFLKRDGKILDMMPDQNIPHDAYGVLAEVRSDPFENPLQTLASYNLKLTELEAMVATHYCTLENIQQYKLDCGRVETAGFHIHFSHGSWVNLAPYFTEEPPARIKNYIAKMDEAFKHLYEDVRRHPQFWRPKPYGWEYRRLPATADPLFVAQVVGDIFLSKAEKAA